MKKEKVIYNGESRVVRTDDKDNKYILYNTKKVYLEKKGGVGSALPPQTSFGLPSSSNRSSSARIASAASALAKTASKSARAAANYLKTDFTSHVSAAVDAYVGAKPSKIKEEIQKLAKTK